MFDFNKLEQLNTEQLKRSNLGDNLNFNKVNDLIIKIKSRLLFLGNNFNNVALANEDRNDIFLFGNNFINFCNEIIEFRHNDGEALLTATDKRDKIIDKFIELKKQFNITILPLIHEAMLFDEETQKKLDNLKQTVVEINKKNEENNNIFNQNINLHYQRLAEMENKFKDKIGQVENRAEIEANNIKREADNVKKILKDFSTEELVGKYGEVFDKQAKTNKYIAVGSLLALIIFGSLLVEYAEKYFMPLINMTLKPDNNISYGFLITNLIFRLTILSVLFIAIKESIKNFNVNMHLYNLNKHRQNALKSFNVFKGMPNTDETRDYLIKEIATTIYSVNKIGYLSESKKTTDVSQIIDLIKALKT